MVATYKRMTREDISDVVSMMHDFYAIDDYPFDKEKAKGLFGQFLANENSGVAWLVLSDGAIAGYIILTFIFSFEFGGRIAFIDELYIKESFRGKGIGKHTMSSIKDIASGFNIKRLYLEVETHNVRAQELYKSAGFSIHNRMFMQYKIN